MLLHVPGMLRFFLRFFPVLDGFQQSTPLTIRRSLHVHEKKMKKITQEIEKKENVEFTRNPAPASILCCITIDI